MYTLIIANQRTILYPSEHFTIRLPVIPRIGENFLFETRRYQILNVVYGVEADGDYDITLITQRIDY